MSHADRMIAEAEARGDAAAVRYWRRIRARVDGAPPLGPELRDRLRILLRPTVPLERLPRAARPTRRAA
jgi:hypothetical protein